MKKNMHYLLAVCLLFTAISVVSSCSREEEKELKVFYLNTDVTKVIPVDYEAEASDQEDLIKELIAALTIDPEDSKCRKVLPANVSIQNWSHKGYFLIVDFNSEYMNLPPAEEILCRAAIVRTLTQVEDVMYVSFTVDSSPLVDSRGSLVGSMSNESFVENPGAQINSSISTSLTLYFSDAEGTVLVPETRVVHHSSNVSIDKLVMEQLIAGPRTSGLQATVPSGTKVITISVVDRVCYVNLDETFMNQNQEITETVVLYSIVDSLANLPEVDKVQISINGDTKGKVRFTYDLVTMYEPDSSLIKNDSATEEEQTEVAE